MSTRKTLALGALVVLAAASPGRALMRAERQCQQATAVAGRQLLERAMGAVAACRRAIARGSLPPGTDCRTDPTASGARTAAAARLAHAVGQACSPAAASTLRPGGECLGVRTVTDLVACLEDGHDADATTLLDVADATAAPPSSDVRHCQDEASQDVRAFAVARLAALQQCKRRPPKDLAPGSDCTIATRTAARIAARRATAAKKIAARCTGSALTGARFGFPCASPTTPDALTTCLLDAATSATDDALAAEFRDPGFCGDASAAVEQRIDDLLSQMSLAEKVEQMHGITFTSTKANTRLGIPGLVMTDGPRGVGTQFGQATCFPVGAARGATWDPALEARVGEAVGTEVRAKGADMILAPTINMLRHPRWGRAQETYGEDTYHIGTMAVGYVQGAQQHIIANPKHFAGNSIEDTRFNVSVAMDERTFREIYTPHFRRAVQEGHAGAVMSAYNKLNGTYCSENVHLLHDVLFGDWGFQGFVESDWLLGVHSTVAAANAGLDVEMPVASFFGQKLIDAVNGGQVSQATLDGAVRRILRAQLCFRLDTDPPVVDPTQVESQAHKDLAREVEQKAIVLLKNAGATLPLDASGLTSIVVVGDLAAEANLGDYGSSRVIPASAVTPLDGIQAAAGGATVTAVVGPTFAADEQTAIAAADVVIVIAGLDHRDEGEGLITIGDRVGLTLPRGQDQMIADAVALNAHTVVVLEGSGAMTMPWVDQVPAILMAWYPGEEGGTAIADVLFGAVNPSGKLPVTFPLAETDLPPFDNVDLNVTYGYYHGYRWLDRNAVAPLFPFGFGLSYTTFQYANLTIVPPAVPAHGRVRVTADVTNTGSVAGDEVAELYVGYVGSSVDHAVRDLKGFARVHLQPGETRTVPFEVRAGDVAFWDSAAGAFTAEPITYRVEVGSSSRDLLLSGTFAVTP